MAHSFAPTELTILKRLPERAAYDRDTIYQILDEGYVCHVGFIANDRPVVIPTGYGRIEDKLYFHGSVASRMLRTLASGIQVSVTVTLLDGLVLARSAFHHSMNYRSVVVFGIASVVEDVAEKTQALMAFSEHIIPGRWTEVREPNTTELSKTLVLRLPLNETSAKVRSGAPVDEDSDYKLSVWAGELPLYLTAGAAIADPRLPTDIETPPYVREYQVQTRNRKAH